METKGKDTLPTRGLKEETEGNMRSQAGRHPEPLFAGVCFPPGRISGAASGRDGGRSGSRLRALRVHHPARRTSWGRPSSRFPPLSDPRDLRTASRRRELPPLPSCSGRPPLVPPAPRPARGHAQHSLLVHRAAGGRAAGAPRRCTRRSNLPRAPPAPGLPALRPSGAAWRRPPH
ncbi:zinc finger protein 580 isoform X2 [Sagmatias obliquidens]|uniref:zinc finger protein 580 isoform X2 n=1 Tax=Sagmatias obliquidens TaxID=3371155 RepID=UPI000F441BDE|nr:zinc finger protein 580 isoform X2 [Lagenorhynchus obliquidens]